MQNKLSNYNILLLAFFFTGCKAYYSGRDCDKTGNVVKTGFYAESSIQVISAKDRLKIGVTQNDLLYCGYFYYTKKNKDTLYYQSKSFPLKCNYADLVKPDVLNSLIANCDSLDYFIFVDSENESISFDAVNGVIPFELQEIKTAEGNLTVYSHCKSSSETDHFNVQIGDMNAIAVLDNPNQLDTCFHFISIPNFTYYEDSRCIPLPALNVKVWKTKDKLYRLDLIYSDTTQYYLLEKGQ